MHVYIFMCTQCAKRQLYYNSVYFKLLFLFLYGKDRGQKNTQQKSIFKISN